MLLKSSFARLFSDNIAQDVLDCLIAVFEDD